MASPLKKPKSPEPTPEPVKVAQPARTGATYSVRKTTVPVSKPVGMPEPEVIIGRHCGGTITAPKSELEQAISSLILRRRRQFLVHSFLYYVLNESLVTDESYDLLCQDLVRLQNEHPALSAKLPFHDLCTQADGAASGFFIRQDMYPEGIVTTAFQLLAIDKDIPLDELVTHYPPYRLLAQNSKRKKGA